MLRYINGIENIKDYVVKFLTYIFLAEEKGQISFYDGHKLLKFSKRPTIVKRSQWDFRTLPCILIGSANGTLEQISIEKDFLGDTVSYVVGTDDPGPTGTAFYETGGEINLSIDIDVQAYTQEERDKLMDIVSVHLASPVAKDYFMKHYTRLPTNVRVREGGATTLPNIETPIYYSSINMDFVGAWRSREYYGARLAQILFDLEFVQSIDTKPKLISADLIGADKVRLTFDLDMDNDAQLTAATNYLFSGMSILTATSATRITSKIVDITFSGTPTLNRTYQISAYNLSSADGVGIDTTSNTAAFFVH